MRVAAVIPMKQQRLCKRRLAPALSRVQRQVLAAWMLERVVTQLRASKTISEIFVLTTKDVPIPKETARIVDPGRGLNAAIELAGELIHRKGFDAILVLPGDVPLVQVADIDVLVGLAQPGSWVLIPDKTGLGTNALLASPANLTETHFGVNSLARHIIAACGGGINVVVHRCGNIARDIDEPCDLEVLRAHFALSQTEVPNPRVSGLRSDTIFA